MQQGDLFKEKMMKYFIFVGLLLISSGLLAADYEVKVCNLQALNTGDNAYLQPCGGWLSKNACPNGSWVTWDMSRFQGKAMYSTALAALTAGKNIKVRLNGSSCASYDVITMVRISNQG